MEFSICSWTFGNEPIESIMKFVKNTGYDSIEIHASLAVTDPEKVNQLSQKYDLKISGLTGDADWPNENKDLANRNPINRKKAIEYFKEQIKAVKNVNGKYLVVCPSSVGKFTQMGEGRDDWDWAVSSVQQLTEIASKFDIKIIIEPLNRYESCVVNTSDDAYRFVKEVNHPIVKTLLDTYHMNIEESDLIGSIRKVQDILDVMHVADNNRQGLGRGIIPFDKIFSELKNSNFDGPIVVECCAPGSNPFSANKDSENMKWIYKYAEESLIYLKKQFC